MKRLITIILFTSSAFQLTAQNRDAIKEWLYSVEKEFPEINKSSSNSGLKSGSLKYNLIRYNLLSDKFFVPVFGKPFDQISQLRRNAINKKIIGFKQKASKYPWAKRLDWYMWGVFRQERARNMAIIEVKERRDLRYNYNTKVKQIKAGNADFRNIYLTVTNVNSLYAKLLPSEIQKVKKTLSSYLTEMANKELLNQVKTIDALESNYSGLLELNSFKLKHYQALQYADANVRKEVQSQLNTKASLLLQALLQPEVQRLEEMTIRELNDLKVNLDQKYEDFSNHKEVKALRTRISKVKSQKIRKQFPQIKSQISSVDEPSTLNEMKQFYLIAMDQSERPLIQEINETISSRKSAIEAEKAQRRRQAATQQRLAEAEAMERFDFYFRTNGLKNKELFVSFFKGDFVNVPFNRDDVHFRALISSFMYAYAKSCPGSLPSGKVQIFENKCAKWQGEKDPVNGRERIKSCVEWVSVPTGLYTSPDLYSALGTIKRINASDVLKTFSIWLREYGEHDGIGPTVELAFDLGILKSDMNRLIEINGCGENSLKRFEQNLIRFAENKPPLLIDGSEAILAADYSKKHDFKALTKAIVVANSKEWAFDYVPRSIADIRIVSRDAQNRPKRITASYRFTGLFGKQKDIVHITFKNGIPDCIYFPNYSNNCRTPDRKIVAQFIRGEYATK